MSRKDRPSVKLIHRQGVSRLLLSPLETCLLCRLLGGDREKEGGGFGPCRDEIQRCYWGLWVRVFPSQMIELNRLVLAGRGRIASDPGNITTRNFSLRAWGPPISHVDAIFEGNLGCRTVLIVNDIGCDSGSLGILPATGVQRRY